VIKKYHFAIKLCKSNNYFRMSKEKSKKKFTIHHQPAIAACWLMMNGKIYCVDNQ